jgi:hypothetical protein
MERTPENDPEPCLGQEQARCLNRLLAAWTADMKFVLDRLDTYHVRPDKESPLWNAHSQVIYWWTATEADDESAYIIVYDGKVWLRRKRFAPASLGYRCVKPASLDPRLLQQRQ